jgi:hypothetical protein
VVRVKIPEVHKFTEFIADRTLLIGGGTLDPREANL